MTWNVRYRPLFALQIEHDAWLDLGHSELASLRSELREQRLSEYQLSNHLIIQPTPDCARMMHQHRLRIQENALGITVYAEVTADPNVPNQSIPVRPFEIGSSLRFALSAKNLSFHSAANVALDGRSQDRYYFSNSHEHQEGGALHLTRPVSAFDPSKNYLAGDLAVDQDVNPTILLEAIRDLAPAASPAASDWLQLPVASYQNGSNYAIGAQVFHAGKVFEAVSLGAHPSPPSPQWRELYQPEIRTGVTHADRIVVLGPEISLPITENLTFAKVIVFRADDSLLLSRPLYHESGDPLSAVALSLAAPSGFYRIEAEDAQGTALAGFPLEFYLDAEPSAGSPFALIEIFHQPGSHAFLNPQGHLLSPTFHVRFRKRHTHWRYTFHGDLSTLPPAQLGALVQENPGDVSRYVSPRPLPLTSGAIALARFGDATFLPNPDLSSTTREGDLLFSETYVHL